MHVGYLNEGAITWPAREARPPRGGFKNGA
jgi:hypothetical protein